MTTKVQWPVEPMLFHVFHILGHTMIALLQILRFIACEVNDHITPHCLAKLQLEPRGTQIQHDTSEMQFILFH